MKELFRIKSKRVTPFAVVALVTGVTAGTLSAKEWQAAAGAQRADLGDVALAFLPNELWIHAGDSIRWAMSARRSAR